MWTDEPTQAPGWTGDEPFDADEADAAAYAGRESTHATYASYEARADELYAETLVATGWRLLVAQYQLRSLEDENPEHYVTWLERNEPPRQP